jgi:hypothetical protein
MLMIRDAVEELLNIIGDSACVVEFGSSYNSNIKEPNDIDVAIFCNDPSYIYSLIFRQRLPIGRLRYGSYSSLPKTFPVAKKYLPLDITIISDKRHAINFFEKCGRYRVYGYNKLLKYASPDALKRAA